MPALAGGKTRPGLLRTESNLQLEASTDRKSDATLARKTKLSKIQSQPEVGCGRARPRVSLVPGPRGQVGENPRFYGFAEGCQRGILNL